MYVKDVEKYKMLNRFFSAPLGGVYTDALLLSAFRKTRLNGQTNQLIEQ